MLSCPNTDQVVAKHPSPLQLACHSFRPVPGSMRRHSLAGHLFASPDDVGTNSEPYKGLRQSLRCFEPEAIQPERIWLAMARNSGHSPTMSELRQKCRPRRSSKWNVGPLERRYSHRISAHAKALIFLSPFRSAKFLSFAPHQFEMPHGAR